MNQKLTQLTEENNKLKRENEVLQGKKAPIQEESKPYLFGPDDD